MVTDNNFHCVTFFCFQLLIFFCFWGVISSHFEPYRFIFEVGASPKGY